MDVFCFFPCQLCHGGTNCEAHEFSPDYFITLNCFPSQNHLKLTCCRGSQELFSIFSIKKPRFIQSIGARPCCFFWVIQGIEQKMMEPLPGDLVLDRSSSTAAAEERLRVRPLREGEEKDTAMAEILWLGRWIRHFQGTIGRLKDGTSTMRKLGSKWKQYGDLYSSHRWQKKSWKSPWCQEPGQSQIDMLGVLHWSNMVKWCYIIHSHTWLQEFVNAPGSFKKNTGHMKQFLDGLFDWYPMDFLGVSTLTISFLLISPELSKPGMRIVRTGWEDAVLGLTDHCFRRVFPLNVPSNHTLGSYGSKPFKTYFVGMNIHTSYKNRCKSILYHIWIPVSPW